MGYYYKRIKELRIDNDYTQKFIAGYLNIRQEYYSKYELGKIEIPAHMIKQLAELYKVSTDYIFERTDNPEINKIKKTETKIKNQINGNNFGKITMK